MPLLNVAAIDVMGGVREDSPEKIESLMRSVQEHGLQQAIGVIENPEILGRHTVVFGRRRLFAVKKLGWEKIDARVLNCDARTAEMLEITENLDRLELTPHEKDRSMKRWAALYAEFHPEAAPAARTLAKKVDAEAADRDDTADAQRLRRNPKGVTKAVAERFGVSPRTVQTAAKRASSFTDEERSMLSEAGVTQGRLDAVAAIPDGADKHAVVNLLVAGMAYPDAMKEVLGDAFPGDPEEEESLTDEEFLNQNPHRKRFDETRYESSALLYRKFQAARIKMAREAGWGAEKKRVGIKTAYFNRAVRFLDAAHPKDWVVCHDCTRGTTKDGPNACTKCQGGGFLIG